MGSAQSSHATNKTKVSVPHGKPEESSVRGRKAVENNIEEEMILEETDSLSDDESNLPSDEEDEEESKSTHGNVSLDGCKSREAHDTVSSVRSTVLSIQNTKT
jgi:hypothetical protein